MTDTTIHRSDDDPGYVVSDDTQDAGDSRQTSASPRPLTRERDSAHKQALLTRLKRIEGQVRGVHRMVDDDTYCIDVLTQVTAIKRALEKVSLLLVEDHLRGCVMDAARSGDDDSAEAHLDEVTAAIGRLLKS